ncbi:MAG TPA: asparaginase [Jatrophihabitans sp.]|nr:asparaginase [Jatrophihabitans sp.]
MIRLSTGVRLVEIERNSVVESVHTGHVIVLAPDGSVRLSLGNPSQTVFARSSLKPLQATGMLRAGLRLPDEELALAAASHSGSPQHLRLIEAMLTGAGLTEADLDCPPALPLGVAEQRAYLEAGQRERRLAMNCSGKHAAMLLTCLANGWPLSGYLAADHPLQQRLAATVAELTGEPIQATAVDGCGAPLFGVSLVGVARAFATLAHGPDQRVAEAMRAHPDLVGGRERSATVLMQRIGGLIAKDGAEGGFAAALPDGGAVAVKIDDGAGRAADVAVARALSHLGVDVGELVTVPVLGGGEPVGLIRPADGW